MLDRDGVARLDRMTPTLAKLLYFGIVFVVLQSLMSLLELSDFVDFDATEPAFLPLTVSAIYFVSFALLLITVILFARWILQSARNLVTAEVDGFTYTPASCVWWYFVPVACLFMPFYAMRQIWNGSHGNDGLEIDAGHNLLSVWWAAWIISSILGNVSLQLQMSGDTPAMGNAATFLFFLSSAVDLVTYPAAIRLVNAINAAQQQTLG